MLADSGARDRTLFGTYNHRSGTKVKGGCRPMTSRRTLNGDVIPNRAEGPVRDLTMRMLRHNRRTGELTDADVGILTPRSMRRGGFWALSPAHTI